MAKLNLGAVTAYADAVKAGFTGTREEFAEWLANAGKNAAAVAANLEESKAVLAGVNTAGEAQVKAVQDEGAVQAKAVGDAAEAKKTEIAGLDAVQFDVPQDKTDAQKKQARTNIDAAAQEDVDSLSEVIAEQKTAIDEKLDSIIGEATQLYNYEDAQTGYYIPEDGGVALTNNEDWCHTLIPCVNGETFYFSKKVSNLAIGIFNEDKTPVEVEYVTKNSYTSKHDGYISIPIAWYERYGYVVSKEPILYSTRNIPYGSTKVVQDYSINTNFNELLKSKITAPEIIHTTGYEHGSVISTSVSDNPDLMWCSVLFGSCCVDMLYRLGLILIGYNNDYYYTYLPSQGTVIQIPKTGNKQTVLKSLDTFYTFKHKKVSIAISNDYLIIKDFYTHENYVVVNIADVILKCDEITLGMCIKADAPTYQDAKLCFVYDTTDFIPYTKKETHISQWNGKKWYAYGTSLTSTAQGKYVPITAEKLGLTYVNKGIPGGALVSNSRIYNALMDISDGKTEADLITIEVGANDSSAPLGEPDSLDTTTICGALNTCLKHILQNCKAQIVVMCSTSSRYAHDDETNIYELDKVYSGGFTVLERNLAIEQCAKANNVYFTPLAQGMGLYRASGETGDYLTDNIHMTDLGGYNTAMALVNYLKTVPNWFVEIP